MKKSSNIILFSFILLTIITMIIIISKDSMAYEYNENDINLFYKEDKEELAKDIKLYIENIDDIILPNSSFNYSDKLNENFDFLVYFALEYIIENHDIYNSDIVKKEKYEYTNLDYETKQTNEYINIDTLYKITNNIIAFTSNNAGKTNFKISLLPLGIALSAKRKSLYNCLSANVADPGSIFLRNSSFNETSVIPYSFSFEQLASSAGRIPFVNTEQGMPAAFNFLIAAKLISPTSSYSYMNGSVVKHR